MDITGIILAIIHNFSRFNTILMLQLKVNWDELGIHTTKLTR